MGVVLREEGDFEGARVMLNDCLLYTSCTTRIGKHPDFIELLNPFID